MGDIPFVEIKSAAKLEDFIEKYCPEVKLKRTGNVYKGNCPFHKEKTGSFVIFTNNNRYKCFGCHEKGSNIDFVMKKFNLDLKEATRILANEVGIEYQVTPPNPHHEAFKDKMTDHARRYWKVLRNNANAMDYFEGRGITEETMNSFRLGLVPDDEYKYRTDMGGIGGRLAFPIMECKNTIDLSKVKVLGMGYRTLKDEKPKYINDPNQDGRAGRDGKPGQDPNVAGVFVKGNTLYGYSHAHQEIRRIKHAIVVEGYMDVIAMHQAGVKNTVGSLGTALTDTQMDMLKKLTDNLIFFYDSDSAGYTNMLRVLPTLLQKGFHVLIVSANNGLDPADVCLANNFDYNSLKAYININAKPAAMVAIENAVKSYEQTVIKERMKALREMLPLLDMIPSPADKIVFEDILYKRLDIKR